MNETNSGIITLEVDAGKTAYNEVVRYARRCDRFNWRWREQDNSSDYSKGMKGYKKMKEDANASDYHKHIFDTFDDYGFAKLTGKEVPVPYFALKRKKEEKKNEE